MTTTERTPERFEERLLAELRTLVAEEPAGVPVPPRRPRRRSAVLLAVAGAGVLMAAGLSFDDRSRVPGGPEGAWAASVLRVADAVPRLLLGVPGWRVERADEFGVDAGEMTLTDGRHSLDLHWREGRWHAGYLRDRAAGAERRGDASVDGVDAALFRSRDTANDFSALWRSDGYSLELATGLSDPADRLDEQAFRQALESLRRVDVDTWLRAMPATVVRPGARPAAVEQMLDGIPLPDGFDRKSLSEGEQISDRYQLGAHVTGEVACAWIRQWLRARRAGDRDAAAAAVTAMGTSRDWPILREMSRDGYYPEAVWEFAEAMAGDGMVRGGRLHTVREAYRPSLGCGR